MDSMRERRGRKHHRGGVPLLKPLAFVAVFALTVAAGPRLEDLPPPISVRVEGEVHYVLPTTTFAGIVRRFQLRPRHGDLFDVEGELLEKRAFPGRILLNGRSEEPKARVRLREGDRIRVVDGRDRTEAIVTEVRPVSAGSPGNPQSQLGTVPGDFVRKKGKVSGKVVSSVFRASGGVEHPPSVALTFDDGPWPGSTLQVLDILKRFGVKATFFVVGYLAESYPELIRAELRAGMAVANHSWSHPEPFDGLSEQETREQIERAKRTLSSLGATSGAFRPPGGDYTDRTIKIAKELGYRLVLWSVDPQDWDDGTTADRIAENVLASVRPGSIILLHDGGGDQSATVQALPEIIAGIKEMGLGFSLL